MGLKVTAEQAGQLVDRHERIVRGHIKDGSLPAEKHGNSWSIDVDALEQIPGWRIDRDRLARLQERDNRTAETMAAKIAMLEREIQALKARIRSIEMLGAPSRVSDDRQAASDALDVTSYQPTTYRPPVEPLARSFSMSFAPAASGGTFRTRSDAARWLMRHGINENTPKSWPGWREVDLEPRSVLQLAMSLYDPTNWRITWRLHQCDDSACVCHELLAGVAVGER